MKNTRSWIGFACLLVGSLFLGSCAKEFKLDSNAVNYRLNEVPLTLHGNRAQLDVNYQIAPNTIAKNGVAVMTLLEKDGGQTKVKSRDLITGPKVKGMNGTKADPLKETAGTLTFGETMNDKAPQSFVLPGGGLLQWIQKECQSRQSCDGSRLNDSVACQNLSLRCHAHRRPQPAQQNGHLHLRTSFHCFGLCPGYRSTL